MNALAHQRHGNLRRMLQSISRIAEEKGMKEPKGMINYLRTGVSKVCTTMHLLKLLGAVALGATLIITIIGVPAGFTNADDRGGSTAKTVEVSNKVERPTGFLNQGQAGYSLKEQMEILEEAGVQIP